MKQVHGIHIVYFTIQNEQVKSVHEANVMIPLWDKRSIDMHLSNILNEWSREKHETKVLYSFFEFTKQMKRKDTRWNSYAYLDMKAYNAQWWFATRGNPMVYVDASADTMRIGMYAIETASGLLVFNEKPDIEEILRDE